MQSLLLWRACHPHRAHVACCREAIRETEFFYEGDNPRSAGQRKFDVLLTSYELVLKDKSHFLSCRQASTSGGPDGQ